MRSVLSSLREYSGTKKEEKGDQGEGNFHEAKTLFK
jgi:hypothetical protein